MTAEAMLLQGYAAVEVPEQHVPSHREGNLESEKCIPASAKSVFLCFVSSFSYNRDSEEFMKWLDSAQQRMNFWKEQSLNVSQDLATIRDNISSLFVSNFCCQI